MIDFLYFIQLKNKINAFCILRSNKENNYNFGNNLQEKDILTKLKQENSELTSTIQILENQIFENEVLPNK